MIRKWINLVQLFSLTVILLLSINVKIFAEIPEIPNYISIESTLAYEGQRLEGTHNVTIKLQDNSDSNDPKIIWEHLFTDIKFNNGKFKLVIGKSKTINPDYLKTNQLDVIIEMDGIEADPIPITAAPYSILSQKSLKAETVPWEGILNKPAQRNLETINGHLIPSQVPDKLVTSRMISTINSNQIVGVPDGFLAPEDIKLDILSGTLDGSKIATESIQADKLQLIPISKITGFPEQALLFWENNIPKRTPITILDNKVGIGTTEPEGDFHIISNEGTGLLIHLGKVGIGTPSLDEKLTVAGTIYSTSGGYKYPDGTTQITAATEGVWKTIEDENQIYVEDTHVQINGPENELLLGVDGGIQANYIQAPTLNGSIDWSYIQNLPSNIKNINFLLDSAKKVARTFPFWNGDQFDHSNIYLSTDGNIGIGTTDTEEGKLNINGSISVYENIRLNGDIIFGDDSTMNTKISLPWKTHHQALYINKKIGIGTNSPSANLHIKSSGTQIRLEPFDDIDNTYTDIMSADGYFSIDIHNPNNFLFEVRNKKNPVMTIDLDGNIIAKNFVLGDHSDDDKTSLKERVSSWNQAVEWGNHQGLYIRRDEEPIFSQSIASKLTEDHLDKIEKHEKLLINRGNHKLAGYLVSGNNLEDLVNISEARQNLGLGTLSILNLISNEHIDGNTRIDSSKLSSDVLISGDKIERLENNGKYLEKTKNLSELSKDPNDQVLARDHLGLRIGTDIHKWSPFLHSISLLPKEGNKLLYTTGEHHVTLIDLSTFSKSLFTDQGASARRSKLNLGKISLRNEISNEDIAKNANISSFKLSDDVLTMYNINKYLNSQNYLLEDNLLGEFSESENLETIHKNIGLKIGTDVHPYSEKLNRFTDLTSDANHLVYFNNESRLDLAEISTLNIDILKLKTIGQYKSLLEIDEFGPLSTVEKISNQHIHEHAEIDSTKLVSHVMIEGEDLSKLAFDSEFADDLYQRLETLGYIKGTGSDGTIPLFRGNELKNLQNSILTQENNTININGNLSVNGIQAQSFTGNGEHITNIAYSNITGIPDMPTIEEQLSSLTGLNIAGRITAESFEGNGSGLTGISRDSFENGLKESLITKGDSISFLTNDAQYVSGNGQPGYVTKYIDNGKKINNSLIYESDESNIGIGMTDPQAKLDVLGTVNATAFTGVFEGDFEGNFNGDGSGLTEISRDSFANELKESLITKGDSIRFLTNDAQYVSGNGQVGYIAKYTGNGRKIHDSGIFETDDKKIGIGTINPQTKLDVLGVVKAIAFEGEFKGDGSNLTGIPVGNLEGGAELIVEGDNISILENDAQYVSGNGQVGYIAKYTGNGRKIHNSEIFETGDKNIGIGTINPQAKLDVNGIVNATAFTGDGSQLTGISVSNLDIGEDLITKGTNISLLTNDAQYVSGNGQVGYIAKYTGNGRKIHDSEIFETGDKNIGIGTINPQAKLDVLGTVKATTFEGEFEGDGSNLTGISVDNLEGGAELIVEGDNISILENDAQYVSGNGTIGFIPMYIASHKIQNSSLSQIGGVLQSDTLFKTNKTIGQDQQTYTLSGFDEVNLANGNKIKINLSSTTSLSFNTIELPDGFVGTFMFIISNSRSEPTIIWPDTVKWPDGEAPPLTPYGTDIITLYYDGTFFYGTALYDFK